MNILRRALGWLALLGAAYFAYIDQYTPEEGVAALLCAAAITAFMLRVERDAGPIALPPLRGLEKLVLRTPLALVKETWFLLAIVLWRRLILRRDVHGRWIELAYEGEGAHEDLGRRALVVLGASITPNAIPLLVDARRQRIVLHQLFERVEPGSRDARYPF